MSHVDEVRVWCRHCCGTGKERFDRRNPCDCDECHGRGYTAVWPTDEQRNAALRERDLRAELAEARRERDEATGERAACMVLFGEYGIKWAEDLPHTVDVLCRRLCCVAIDNGRAERALASADVHVQWLRAERAEQSCLALERDAAEAMALVLNHEGHITKLEAELAEARRAAADWEETAGRCSDAGGVCYTNMRAAMTERDRWKQQVYDYENKEAKCCPEDVGFSEWIAALTKKLDAALARLADPRLAAWREVPDDDREAIAFGMACDATDAEVCCCHETYPDKKCRHHAAVIRIAAAVLEWAQEGRE